MAKSRISVALSLVIAILLSSQRVTAQNPSTFYEEVPRTFYGGVLVGTNFTQVDGDAYAGYHKIGLNLGGIVYTRFSEHIAGSLEILFSQKGSRGHQVQPIGATDSFITGYNINLNYAEVPLMLNYFDRRKSHFGAGFSYSRLISGEEKIEVTQGNRAHELDATAYPFLKSDINFLLSGNLHLVKGLFLNARFQYSLIPIRKTHYPGIGRAEQYNNLWAVRLMYLF
jgi:hypothetical protein